MTIPAKKFAVNLYLISTILWGTLTIYSFFNDQTFKSVLVPIYILSTFIWGFLYWHYRKGVIKVEDEILSVNGIFTDSFSLPKWNKFNLYEVSVIKNITGDYVFTSKERQVSLASASLDEKYIPTLKEELRKYGITLD